ncbi:MAG: hypothetical protein AAGB24_11975 [Bacteroidota bacterium]
MDSGSIYSLLVYKKSIDLYDLSRAVASYFSHNKDTFTLKKSTSFRDNLSDSLLTDASMIKKEVEHVFESNSHAKKMKSLIFINIMTRNILAYCNGFERDGVKEKEYLNLLRQEIKVFRKSFKKWRHALQGGQ